MNFKKIFITGRGSYCGTRQVPFLLKKEIFSNSI